MAFSIRNIREIPADPLTRFANEIAKKLSRFLTKDQVDLVEDNEDIYSDGRDLETVIKFHDELQSTHQFFFDTEYKAAFEPDGNKLRLWIQGVNIGNNMTDWSLNGKDIDLFGEPMLVDGAPFDPGIKAAGVKSIALRMNRPTSRMVNDEYIQVADSTSLQISGLATGISYFMRFKIHSLTTQGGLERTLFEKIDGSTVQDAVVATISNTGRIKFHVKRSGTWHNAQTPNNTVGTGIVYDVFFTFTQSGSVIHVYVNGVDQTLTDPGNPTTQSDTDNHDLWLCQRGKGPEEGFFYGDLYDFRLYREKVISATEVSQMFANKWTISNIPYGEVMVANYWATFGTGSSPGLFRVSLIQRYKWHVVGVTPSVGVSFSATTFTPSFTGGLGTALTRVSLSRTYKYSVQKRLSLSRRYKWDVTGIAATPSFTTTSYTTTSFTT